MAAHDLDMVENCYILQHEAKIVLACLSRGACHQPPPQQT